MAVDLTSESTPRPDAERYMRIGALAVGGLILAWAAIRRTGGTVTPAAQLEPMPGDYDDVEYYDDRDRGEPVYTTQPVIVMPSPTPVTTPAPSPAPPVAGAFQVVGEDGRTYWARDWKPADFATINEDRTCKPGYQVYPRADRTTVTVCGKPLVSGGGGGGGGAGAGFGIGRQGVKLEQGGARTHTVTAGETIKHIAQRYGIGRGRLWRANYRTIGPDWGDVAPGMVLLIPGK